MSGVKNRLQPNAVPVPSLITSNKSEMPEIECVVIINTPGANNSGETTWVFIFQIVEYIMNELFYRKEEIINNLPDSSFDRTKDESIFSG